MVHRGLKPLRIIIRSYRYGTPLGSKEVIDELLRSQILSPFAKGDKNQY